MFIIPFNIFYWRFREQRLLYTKRISLFITDIFLRSFDAYSVCYLPCKWCFSSSCWSFLHAGANPHKQHRSQDIAALIEIPLCYKQSVFIICKRLFGIVSPTTSLYVTYFSTLPFPIQFYFVCLLMSSCFCFYFHLLLPFYSTVHSNAQDYFSSRYFSASSMSPNANSNSSLFHFTFYIILFLFLYPFYSTLHGNSHDHFSLRYWPFSVARFP